MVVAGIGMVWQQSNISINPNGPQNAVESPANCENGPRKVMNYEGYTMGYVSIGDYTCTSETLQQQVSDIFEGLVQDSNLPFY